MLWHVWTAVYKPVLHVCKHRIDGTDPKTPSESVPGTSHSDSHNGESVSHGDQWSGRYHHLVWNTQLWGGNIDPNTGSSGQLQGWNCTLWCRLDKKQIYRNVRMGSTCAVAEDCLILFAFFCCFVAFFFFYALDTVIGITKVGRTTKRPWIRKCSFILYELLHVKKMQPC